MSDTTTISAAGDHSHHWVIEEASGPVSRGTCKLCNAQREFKNWLKDGDFVTNTEHREAA